MRHLAQNAVVGIDFSFGIFLTFIIKGELSVPLIMILICALGVFHHHLCFSLVCLFSSFPFSWVKLSVHHLSTCFYILSLIFNPALLIYSSTLIIIINYIYFYIIADILLQKEMNL